MCSHVSLSISPVVIKAGHFIFVILACGNNFYHTDIKIVRRSEGHIVLRKEVLGGSEGPIKSELAFHGARNAALRTRTCPRPGNTWKHVSITEENLPRPVTPSHKTDVLSCLRRPRRVYGVSIVDSAITRGVSGEQSGKGEVGSVPRVWDRIFSRSGISKLRSSRA